MMLRMLLVLIAVLGLSLGGCKKEEPTPVETGTMMTEEAEKAVEEAAPAAEEAAKEAAEEAEKAVDEATK